MEWKYNGTSGATEATAPSARAHNAGDGGAVAGQGRRFLAQRKLSAVQRLFRGESLDVVSRDLGVPVHRLTEWRDRALAGAEGARGSCPRVSRHPMSGRDAGWSRAPGSGAGSWRRGRAPPWRRRG